MKKFFKEAWVFIPLIIALLMYFLLPKFPWFTEYICSRVLFKLMTVPVGFLTSLAPISLTEWLVLLAIPIVLFLLILLLVKLKGEHKGRTLLKAGKFVVGVTGIAALVYMIGHGANFYRYPIEQIMELDTSPKTADDLLSACKKLAEGANEARAELNVDENNCVVLPKDIYTELSRTNSGYKSLEEEYPFLWTPIKCQKPVIFSEQWSYTGIVGMYCPFLVECNVNVAQPDFAIPNTAAHESAHSRGIAFENECNFLAFLSCISSEYPEFRYSGYMEAFKFCSNALYSYDQDLWREACSYLSDGMLADFGAENDYIHSHEGKVMETSNEINDTFIKVQGVPDGTLSYDRVTALILAYYAKAD